MQLSLFCNNLYCSRNDSHLLSLISTSSSFIVFNLFLIKASGPESTHLSYFDLATVTCCNTHLLIYQPGWKYRNGKIRSSPDVIRAAVCLTEEEQPQCHYHSLPIRAAVVWQKRSSPNAITVSSPSEQLYVLQRRSSPNAITIPSPSKQLYVWQKRSSTDAITVSSPSGQLYVWQKRSSPNAITVSSPSEQLYVWQKRSSPNAITIPSPSKQLYVWQKRSSTDAITASSTLQADECLKTFLPLAERQNFCNAN